MESDRGFVKIPSLAKKSMTFLRDAYNMASHSGSSSPSNMGVQNQHSFQPSQGLSHHFGQNSQQQQYLRPNMHVHSHSWSGPQTHSTPNLGTYPHSPGVSPVSPPMKASTLWSTANHQAVHDIYPPPPYKATNFGGSRLSARHGSQDSQTNQQQQKPSPVQVFSPDDYHEIYQSESAHNVPKPPQRTTSSAASRPLQQQYQAPPPPQDHTSTQHQQYPAYSPPAQQHHAVSPPNPQHPTHSPPPQQYQAHFTPTQQYPFPPQQQPYVPPQESQHSFQHPPLLQHSYSYSAAQHPQQQAYQPQEHYPMTDPPPSIYPAQGYYQPYTSSPQPHQNSPPPPALQAQPQHSQTWPQLGQEQQAQPPASQVWPQLQQQQQYLPNTESNYLSYHPPPPQTITSPVPSVAVSPPTTEMPTPNAIQSYQQDQQQYQPQHAQATHHQVDSNTQNQYQHQYEFFGLQQQHSANQHGNEQQQPPHAAYQHQPYQYQAYQGFNINTIMPVDGKAPVVTSQIPIPAVAELPG